MAAINELGNNNLIPRIGQLEGAFVKELTSAQQARDVAREQAPQYQALFKRKRLRQVASQSGQDVGRARARAPKV